MNAYELADEIDSIAKDWLGQNKSGQLANVLRQQADRIAELEKENSNLKYEISSGAWQPKEATDQELFNIYAHLQDTYEGDNFPVALGRTILKLYTTPQTKPLSDAIEIVKEFQGDHELVFKAYEDTYANGWTDACNEILWAIEAKVRGEK